MCLYVCVCVLCAYKSYNILEWTQHSNKRSPDKNFLPHLGTEHNVSLLYNIILIVQARIKNFHIGGVKS